MRHGQGSQFLPRDHPNSSTQMHMMRGGSVVSSMPGIPNQYNGQQRMQAERTVGVHLSGFPMSAGQFSQTQASPQHFAREVSSLHEYKITANSQLKEILGFC